MKGNAKNGETVLSMKIALFTMSLVAGLVIGSVVRMLAV